MKQLLILCALLVLASCKSHKAIVSESQQFRYVYVHDTVIVDNRSNNAQTAVDSTRYIATIDKLRQKYDSIIITINDSGKVIAREEYHITDNAHSRDAESVRSSANHQTSVVNNNSIKTVRDSAVQVSNAREVKKTANTAQKIVSALLIVICIGFIVYSLKSLKNKQE